MNRRNSILAFAALPTLAAAEVWNVIERSKIVHLTYWNHTTQQQETVKGIPQGIRFGRHPFLYSTTWQLEFLTTEEVLLSVSLNDIKGVIHD